MEAFTLSLAANNGDEAIAKFEANAYISGFTAALVAMQSNKAQEDKHLEKPTIH